MATHTTPLQYCFFGIKDEHEDLAQLRAVEDELVQSADAPNTVKAYAQAWKGFEKWCREWRYCDSLPATPEILRQFISWATEVRKVKGVTQPYAPMTIQLFVTAIKRYHREAGFPAPIDERVREVLAGVMRKAARSGARAEYAGKKNLTVEQLTKICRSFGSELIDERDRALILLGFGSALRRSDIARLQTDHVHFEGKRIRLWVPYSKTDQKGKGRDVYLDRAAKEILCPVRALETWKRARLAYSGNWRGPLFVRFTPLGVMTQLPFSEQGICEVVKRRLGRCGEDARDYGAHSLRSGMITAADAGGATLRSIMDQSGHKSLPMVLRYIKSNRAANPLAGVL